MDVTYTCKFDAKRYAQAVKKAVAFADRGARIFAGCLLVVWIVHLFVAWLGEWSEDDRFLVWFLLFLVALLRGCRCVVVRFYVRQAQRMLGGDVPTTCRLTDVGFETVCGELVQKMPWQKTAAHYQFLDADTVSLMLNRAMPVMVLSDLRAHGIDRDELEAVFCKAGLLPMAKSWKYRARMVVVSLIGGIMVVLSAISAHTAIVSYCWCMRCQETRIRLFDLIHQEGEDDICRPQPLDTVQAKIVRMLMGARAPDELAYVFAPNEEHDKIGLVARYGERCCEAYVPCGCAGIRPKCYWDSLQTNRSETIYLESEKAKWLEKVRPLVESL